MQSNLRCDKRQSIVGKKIILIEQRTPFAARQGKRRIRARRNMPVLFAEEQLDAPVAPPGIFEKGPNSPVGGRIISNAQFPPVVNLSPRRSDRFLEKIQIGVVNRQKNRNGRLIRELLDLAAKAVAPGRRQS